METRGRPWRGRPWRGWRAGVCGSDIVGAEVHSLAPCDKTVRWMGCGGGPCPNRVCRPCAQAACARQRARGTVSPSAGGGRGGQHGPGGERGHHFRWRQAGWRRGRVVGRIHAGRESQSMGVGGAQSGWGASTCRFPHVESQIQSSHAQRTRAIFS